MLQAATDLVNPVTAAREMPWLPGRREARLHTGRCRVPGGDLRAALAHVKPGEGAADDQALDLAGALEDGEDLGIPVPAFHRVIAGVAVPAEYLDRLLGDPPRGPPRH